MKRQFLLAILYILTCLGINAQVGTLDSTFNAAMLKFGLGTGASSTVNSIAIQSDGKILIGGSFTTYNGSTVNCITRLNSDGSIDTGFNPGGTGANFAVSSIAIQSDGKILIGGSFTTYNGSTVNYITRLNSDGSIDTGFNSSGTGANTPVLSIAIQSDGKILIGGAFSIYNGIAAGRIIRLNSDGSRDTDFNSGGVGANSTVRSIAIQNDGDILIGGVFTGYNGSTVNYITRLNSDGIRDTGFNSSGTGANGFVNSIAIQSDGKILIGGVFTGYNGSTVNYITRLNSDGSIDTGFNSSGTGANGTVNSIAMQSDGKILIGGSFTDYNGSTVGRITRLNSDGSRGHRF